MINDQRILIVDDNNDRRLQLRKLLEVRNCTAIEASNCEDALQLLTQFDIHLILTETELPTMSGLYLLQKVKHDHPDTEVILLTNNASSFNLLQALRLGAYDFIVRPIDTGEILDKALERVFTHIRLRLENAQLMVELEKQNANLQHNLNLFKTLNYSMDKVTAATDVLEVFRELLSSALNAVEARRGLIVLLDHRSGELKLRAGSGISAELCKRYTESIPPGLISDLFRRNEPLLVSGELSPQMFNKARHVEISDLLAHPGMLVAPLRFLKREVGLMVLSGRKDGTTFSEHDLHFVIQLAHHACLVLEKAGEIHLLKKQIGKKPGAAA